MGVYAGDQKLFESKTESITESITESKTPHNHARNNPIVPNHRPRKYLKNKGCADCTEHYESAALTAELRARCPVFILVHNRRLCSLLFNGRTGISDGYSGSFRFLQNVSAVRNQSLPRDV